MNIVGAERDDLIAVVERIERFRDGIAGLLALELVRAGVFEVGHHMIHGRVRRVLMHPHVVAGIRHLRPRNDDSIALVKNKHLQRPPGTESIATPRRLRPDIRLSSYSSRNESRSTCASPVRIVS